jgi:predicted dehydrogenase
MKEDILLMSHDVWLVGAGVMALDYAKVLKALDIDFMTIGRGDDNASNYEHITGMPVVRGGLERFLDVEKQIPHNAIVCVDVNDLKNVTLLLIRHGVTDILVEKPAGLNRAEIEEVEKAAATANARVFVAYNRRFYASVQKAREIIANDGGVSSFNFEFTEWSHVIETLAKADVVKKNWLLANSTHVIDMAFFLGGCPAAMVSYTSGGIAWHPSASVFSGAGVTDHGALFSYQANWGAPGRWGVEVLTNRHRFIFRPLEKLQIQKTGSVSIEPYEIDDRMEIAFKPGLYDQVKNFMEGRTVDFCTITDQCTRVGLYEKIAGYC